MATQINTTTQHHGLAKRRQNRSCDQCRRSKRACDALFLQLEPAGAADASTSRIACSYCVKTKKKCTMVMTEMHIRSARKNSHKSSASSTSPRITSLSNAVEPSVVVTRLDDSPQHFLQFDHPEHDLHTWDFGTTTEEFDFSAGGCDERLDPSILDGGSVSDVATFPGDYSMPGTDLLQGFPSANIAQDHHHSGEEKSDYGSQISTNSTGSGFSPRSRHAGYGTSASDSRSFSAQSPRFHNHDLTSTCYYNQNPIWAMTPASPSPYSIEEKATASYHRQMTSSNLIRIYHDVMEHHLSCWVAEMTCPYQPKTPKTGIVTKTKPEWGLSWNNRMLERTVKLDRVAQSCRLLRLTPSEQKAASNALNLSVMAFATQWAQGSTRARRRYSSTSQDDVLVAMTADMSEEFDRTLQHYFWTQAYRAIQDAAHIDSYQVACAELIFSLTQRPLNTGQPQDEEFYSDPSQPLRSQIQQIIERDGPPIFSERAARRMHTLKYRCDNLEKGFRSRGKNVDHAVRAMSPHDRESIGLLYWLTLMFDTVAASLYERPLVVLDEDCRYEVQRDAGSSNVATRQDRWDYEIFMKKGCDAIQRTSWPCSYEAAAEDCTRAAPVKVSIFRHVSYLQNALRKGAPDHQLEDIIFNTCLIYDYWNKTHGAFFRELVQDFPNVPSRIQCWFVCLSAHWNLANLMFADLVEYIDENDLGMEGAKHEREATGMVARLRQDSARELADVASVAALPKHLAPPPQSPDFHHAVNEGTVLTEPWTMIMIRAFSRSCIYFLDKAEESRAAAAAASAARADSGSACVFKEDLHDAENCIKVLWLLGKKSDMAWDIAEKLQQARRMMQSGFVWHML